MRCRDWLKSESILLVHCECSARTPAWLVRSICCRERCAHSVDCEAATSLRIARASSCMPARMLFNSDAVFSVTAAEASSEIIISICCWNSPIKLPTARLPFAAGEDVANRRSVVVAASFACSGFGFVVARLGCSTAMGLGLGGSGASLRSWANCSQSSGGESIFQTL